MEKKYATLCYNDKELFEEHYTLSEINNPESRRVKCQHCGAWGYFSRYELKGKKRT